MKDCKLSTKDNPFDPFEQFHEWYSFDMEKGYDCCGRLNRIAKFSDNMTEIEECIETERAIDTIIKNDILDIFIKKTREFSYKEADMD